MKMNQLRSNGGRLSRRRFLETSAMAGAALAGSASIASRAMGQATPEALGEASGDLTEWGFGIQETNPLARARVLAFQEAYPDVNLNIVETFDEQTLLTAAASDTLPDVIWLSRFETASWASRGVLQPLTELIERDGYDTSMFYDWALEEASYDGELYGIPGGADVRALYLNLDHLEEAGVDGPSLDTSDWAQFGEIGSQLVARDGDIIERWGFDPRWTNFWLWGYGNGGRFMDESGAEATFNDPQIVEALDWMVQSFDAQGGFTDYLTVASTWQGDEQFARGQVAMTLYEQWMLSSAVSTISPDMNFWILPVRENGSGPDGPMTTYSGGNGWYITSGAQNLDAAWEFIKYLHTVDTWMVGARAVKAARQEAGNPYFPSLTGNRIADQLQIEELYEPINEAFDNAVEVFPALLEESHYRAIARSPAATQLDQIMINEGVSPALNGEMSAQESLDAADEAAQAEIDFL
ncbi:MAG: extracellular solute-binding protein [Chloroflexota bacterium]|nr:extracellular solute-binding protein [Chloroflexota bacterium]